MVTMAQKAAARATSLTALREEVAAFEGCNLRLTATNLVFGAGEPRARLMLVGDIPSLQDDVEGQPFTGTPGELLDHMLASIGIDRRGVYMAHLLPWRPPAGVPPARPRGSARAAER